jgi:hypothetical protein
MRWTWNKVPSHRSAVEVFHGPSPPFPFQFSFETKSSKLKHMVIVGAKAKTPPFARGLRCSRWSDGDKAGRDTLRRTRHFDEGLRRRPTTARPRSVPRPTCDLAHCNGPRVAASVLRA